MLWKLLHLRFHVGISADPVGRVCTFQNPDVVVRPRALGVSCRAFRFVASKTLGADLGCEHVFGCLGGLSRRSRMFTARHQAAGDKKNQE